MNYTSNYWADVAKASKCVPNASKLYGKSVMITGATGMICSAVVDLLIGLNKADDAGITVIAAVRNQGRAEKRFSGLSEKDGLQFMYYDATETSGLCCDKEIDYIIHGASNAHPGIYLKEPVETILANVMGLDAMLKLAVDKSVQRLLYISSSEVYGKKDNMEPYGETEYGFVDILNERAGYPCSKRTGEALCVAYGMEHGLDTVMVRPGHIYGPTITDSDNRASAEFTRKALNGEKIVMKSKGTQLRSYCHTLDCASAILTVLLEGQRGTAYNISNPNSICTIADIAKAFADAAGTDLVFELPTEAEQKSFNLMSNSSLCSERLEGLGWHACYSLEEGVQETLDVMKG